MAKDWRTLKLEVLAETTQFVKGMDKANDSTKSFGDKVTEFGKKAAVALAAVGAAAGAMAIKVGKEAIEAASNLAETTSKVNVIFEEAASQIEEFGKTAAASLGQTRTQAMDAAATFATFGKSAGLTGRALAEFSLEFVQLASDLASFNNTTVDQAIVALGAALRGESEPIRAYGVLLNDATLKAQATAMGIYDGTEKLTVQQKVLAAHQVVLAQTRDAQGDFARTADGMANSQRILTARIEETKIILGEALLPTALLVVRFFNDKLVPILENVAKAFGGTGEGDGVIDRVKRFITVSRDALNPIIEAIQNAFTKVSSAIKDNQASFESILEMFQTVWGFLNTYMVPLLKTQLVAAIKLVGDAFSVVLRVVTPIVGFISEAIEAFISLIDKAIKKVNDLISAYNRVPILPNIGLIGGAGTSRTSGAGLPTSEQERYQAAYGKTPGDALSEMEKQVGSVEYSNWRTWQRKSGNESKMFASFEEQLIEHQRSFAEYQASQGKKAAAPAAAAAAVAAAAAKSTAKAAAATTSGTEVFGLGAFRLGEALSMGQYTINVNAPSIIDEEGFARVMVEALNRAQNRTGGGGGKIEMATL